MIEVELSVRLFATVREPPAVVPLPPKRAALALTMTGPPIVPVPPSTLLLLFTVTALLVIAPFTSNVPALTVVAPV